MTTKYIVWVKIDGKWQEQGDGPMGPKTAERVARELYQAGYPSDFRQEGRPPLQYLRQLAREDAAGQ